MSFEDRVPMDPAASRGLLLPIEVSLATASDGRTARMRRRRLLGRCVDALFHLRANVAADRSATSRARSRPRSRASWARAASRLEVDAADAAMSAAPRRRLLGGLGLEAGDVDSSAAPLDRGALDSAPGDVPVRNLLLWRHAKSSWADPSSSDRARPLTSRGRRAARAIVQHLIGEPRRVPTLILCSPARRTLETLAPLLPSLSADVLVRIEESLYLADASSLLARLREVPDEQPSVLLIGHNPGLQELASTLARSRRNEASRQLREKLPTGALVELEIVGASWHELRRRSARLVAMTRPRDLED
ncbi:MAG: histidine phosphatase family protein [Myxococcota bacterium]|nr:histidine phosphatase family protein [Myxococcota bacterium]